MPYEGPTQAPGTSRWAAATQGPLKESLASVDATTSTGWLETTNLPKIRIMVRQTAGAIITASDWFLEVQDAGDGVGGSYFISGGAATVLNQWVGVVHECVVGHRVRVTLPTAAGRTYDVRLMASA